MSRVASLGVWMLFFATGVLAYLVMRPSPREVAFAAAGDGGPVAFVTERRCVEGVCQTLWAGPDRGGAEELAALDPGSTVDEVVWLPDGKRVAFLVDGYQLRLYDTARRLPAGQITLVEPQERPSVRIARGVTFSENGRAVTFDDCPRARSGCRAGLAAVPQP